MCRGTVFLSTFVLLFGSVSVLSTSEGDPCVSLEKSPFEMCMKAGYDRTVPFPEDFTATLQQEAALEMKELFKQVNNCSTNGLAETIECSFVAPKCNSLGEPVYPCKQVCAEFLKQCERDLSELTLDFLISSCLLLSNGSSSCAQCYTPPNFPTVNASKPGPLDRGCQELIIPACKNLGAYNNTLTSVPAQKEMYSWFYGKDYAEDSAETDFPEIAQKMFEQYPKCQENIKKLFCGEYLPPCFPDEDPRLYSLCQPLCDQIATDCPGFFSHDLMGAEYCSTMARGQTKHGYCQSTDWPAAFSWVRYVEATMAPSAVHKGKGLKGWAIVLAILLPLLIVGLVVGLVVARVVFWKKNGGPRVAYTNYYKKQADDNVPLETDANVDSTTV